MSLSIYNYVSIFLAFWLFRICLRSILALRFHFRFGRLGLFSISNIRYHHHRSSETALWSIHVGKLKLRLKQRPTLASPTPFITIYVADIHVQLHSLAALAAAARQHKAAKLLAKKNRFSQRVTSTIKKIPWWYSLSIVKHVIKFTSALPAQLLMAGIANYVDLQVDNFHLEIEKQAAIKVHHVNFSSILFANVTLPTASACNSVPNSVPSSPNASMENFHQHLTEGLSKLHAGYQRHSLKRAQHLFKEKFFEIMVKIGTVSFVDMKEEEDEMLTLPTGGQIAVSCHLSAGCVTLKDVDVNTRVDTFKIKLNPFLDLMAALKQPPLSTQQQQGQEEQQKEQMELDQLQQPENDHNKIQLLRSVTFSVDNTIVETKHQTCHSSLILQEIYITGNAESCVAGVDPYYKLQLLIGLTSWTIFDKSLLSRQMKMINLPEIKLIANVAQTIIMPNKKGHMDNTADLDALPSSFEKGKTIWSSDNLGPNQKFVNVTLSVHEPRLYLDVSKMDLLDKLSFSKKKNKADVEQKEGDEKKKMATRFNNLPRASLSISIERPCIHMKSSSKHMGVISWSGITFEASGVYCAQKNRPASVISRYSEPMTSTTSNVGSEDGDRIEFQADSSAIQRINTTHTRPSWTNLFRRSWRSKGGNYDASQKNTIEWHYKASMRATIQHTCFEDIHQSTATRPSLDNWKQRKQQMVDESAFISVGNFECAAHTRLNVSFSQNSQQRTNVVWDPDTHHVEVDVAIDKPLVNLWTKTKGVDETQLVFWTSIILHPIKSSLGKKKKEMDQQHQQPSKSNSYLYKYMSILNTNIMITDAAIVLEGVDKGLKGKRSVPNGYIDNAPEKDMQVRLILSIQQIALVFHGSLIYATTPGHKKQNSSLGSTGDFEDLDHHHSNETMDKNQVPFGSSRMSIKHVILERIFKLKDSSTDAWHHHQEHEKTVIMWISRINTRTDLVLDSQNQQVMLLPSIVVKKNGIQYSITNHYACLVTVLSTKDLMQRCFPKAQTTPSTVSSKKAAKKLILSKLQFQINRSDIHIFLPAGTTQLYIRMDSLRTQWNNSVEHQGEVPPTAIRNLTLYGVAPRRLDQWDQLLEMDNMGFSIEKDVDFDTGTLTKRNQLSMSKLYLRIPYGYELSHFVDCAVTLVKSIKATHLRLQKKNPFLFFGPTEKKIPALIPNMRLVCDVFTFQFEDDPFEARLRSIFKTGLLEQANRIAIQDAFEVKAQTLMRDSNTANRRGSERDSLYINEETDARVNEAWQGLQEHNSKSWKRHIDAALSKETSSWQNIQAADYRHAIIFGQLDEIFDDNSKNEKTKFLSDMFCIQVTDLPLYPPLLDLTIKMACLDFRPPDFDLGKTREFIYDVGKGQPLDTPLSTLVPFHLDWKSGETWAQIRDYPIPFVLVPPNPMAEEDSTMDPIAWKLSGNYVLGDDLGDIQATRSIHVAMVDENHADYAIDIARTSTPLKFFSIVNIDVHTSGMSHICWSVPYLPAIQDISRVLDTFTRPPVDPSQKVGFWDKIRLLIHTRVKISFVGGGDLAIVMKGSRNPYDMSEKGFGLAKVWRNDVVWLLGGENPQGEFMQIISRDYAFGVPDLVRGGYTAPFILAADSSARETGGKSQKEMRQSTSMSSFNSSTLSKDNENELRFVKIALKLSGGIRMGLGCHLERKCVPDCEICDEAAGNCTPEEREAHKSKLLEFMPHYKVKFRAPQNVHEENHDAYKGFRSDYVHASISIVKLSSEETDSNEKGSITGNSMHLTPGFIDHFVSWFRLFGGAMSYPLRDGSLFPKSDTRPSQKFGRHMRTMKYKVVVNPLTVGYFMKDENIAADDVTTEDLGDSVGLKGLVNFFSVDMHQRREIVNIANYKLDQKRLKANWPIGAAELQLNNIDLRAVRARYTSASGDESISSSGAENVSVPVQDPNYLSDQSDNGLDMMEGLNYQCNNNESDSADWVDLDDFIEIDVATPFILPAVQVLPFAFSPCIYYLRQANKDDIQKYKYLHKTHDCILGTAAETREMQMTLLHDRSKSIDVQIRKHQTRLHNIEVKRLQHGADEKALEQLSDAIVEKTRILYEKRELLQRYLKELSTQAMPDFVHGKKSDVYGSSTIFGKDPLAQWEELMGYFKVRYIAHNPQILWNNSVRNIIYHAMDLRDHRRALSYYMTSRTVKFLRDLIDASDLRYGDGNKQFVLDDDEGGMDSSMAEDLIAKLLAEHDTKFYAPNETEEETPFSGVSTDEVDMSRSDNINNPVMQLKTIPNNYVMKSSYLIDLLNPQISLQSDCDPNNIVLVANERTQVKAFNIIDETDPDVEMEIVKHRTVVSLDNLQFYVAKKEQFDSVDLLLDNHYGAKESDHWLAWIPPEMMISYVKRSDQFQRIGDRIAATLQYEKYNPLRIKSNTNVYSEVHPFEDRCDSVQLNFPMLKMTADSSQYNALYQVATDLLLYKEPAKKERLARLREIMMAADRSSLYEATEKIVDLQNRARQLIHARDQYRQNMAILDDKRIEEFKSIRLTLYDTMEELYLGMEAIKLMQSNQRRDYHEPKTNLKFVFCAEKLVWEMLSKGDTPLCECNLTNFNFIFVSKEDHSSTNTLEVDILQVKNTSPNPVFVDVLGPYYDPRKPYDFSRHKMLRCYFVSLAPVGGIPVIQHLETNLHPLRVQMTYLFGKALAYYLFPPEKRQKPTESAPMTTSTSTPTAASSSAPTPDYETDMSNSGIIIPQQSSSERTDTKEAASRSCVSVKTFDSAPPSFTASTIDSQRFSANSGVSSSLAMTSRDNDAETDTQNDSPSSSATVPVNSSKRFKSKGLHKLTKFKTPDDLSVMKKRASSNRAFILVKIPGARHCLSYQGPKEKNIEDLRDFAFEQPTLEFRNETWSWFELMSNIKKDFMRAALLHNSTALLKEKLLRRHPRAENSKLIEGSISLYSTPVYTPDHEKQIANTSAYDADNNSEATESSRDDAEDLDKDSTSLHSAHSYEAESPEIVSKRSHIWSKLKKPKKSQSTSTEKKLGRSVPEILLHNSSNSTQNLSIDTASTHNQRSSSNGDSPIIISRSVSAATRHLQEDDQLSVKGKYLLGKYYNGPTQWLAPGSKMKGKQVFKK